MKYLYILLIIGASACSATKSVPETNIRHKKENTIVRAFINYFDPILPEKDMDLGQILNLPKDFAFEAHQINGHPMPDKYNRTHVRYDVLYKGFRVDGTQLVVHTKNGVVELINGQYFRDIKMDFAPGIDEAKARSIALKSIDAEEYSWESERKEWYAQRNKELNSIPNGEIIIYPKRLKKDTFSLVLAYKFWVLATKPQSENFIYVDAKNGEVIGVEPSSVNINGTGDTRYSGTQTISTTQVGSNYVLQDNSRGLGIETLDMNQGTNKALAIDFADNDNDWSSSEHRNAEMDDAALDVHWGLGKTYDYFLSIHGRNSFDDAGEQVKGYVHEGVNWNNAGWSSYLRVLSFGDGDGIVTSPYTSLDIVAHEFGHGVSRSTANFSLYGESGALMEGFSDIWAVCVENYVDSNRDLWSIGDEVSISGTAIRDMADPNSLSHPDTYGMNYWVIGNGNHINCTVLDHWFYLLSVGGSGVNDLGKDYDVAGIGIEKAELIAYETMVSLTPLADFHDTRNTAIQVAKNIFGNCSQELMSTLEAWYAVGVGPLNKSMIHLTSPINTSGANLHSAYKITATNLINSNANATYEAGKEIRLLPGFHGRINSKFHGYICPRL